MNASLLEEDEEEKEDAAVVAATHVAWAVARTCAAARSHGAPPGGPFGAPGAPFGAPARVGPSSTPPRPRLSSPASSTPPPPPASRPWSAWSPTGPPASSSSCLVLFLRGVQVHPEAWQGLCLMFDGRYSPHFSECPDALRHSPLLL